MKKYTVAIIGCGSIGALKPDHIDFPGSPNILTHANAVYMHTRTELIAFVDTDLATAHKAENKWGPAKVYPNVAALYKDENPDIVVCAAPTENHYSIIMELLLLNVDMLPQLIIAEKPLCQNLDESSVIKKQSERLGIPIAVDYIRRYAKEYRYFKAQIGSSTLGKALNARVLYCRGLKHEGCHALDLMRYFFGECVATQPLHGEALNDRSDTDLTTPIWFQFEKCRNVAFQPCDGRKYGVFEIDICFENGRYRFIDNGLFVERYPILEENEWGHKSLNYRLTSVVRQETGLNTALYCLVDNAVNFLDGNADLICAADDAIEVHKILEGVK